MSTSNNETPANNTGRRLSYLTFAVMVVVYLVILQGGGRLIAAWADEDDIFSTRGVIFNLFIPIGLALVFVYAMVAVLGWWRPVFKDDRPVSRWVWVVPAILLMTILIGINYSGLADNGWLYAVVLLIATQFVGWGEEGMFRGIGVVMLRQHGLREGRVALWSSIIFGLVHLSNAFSHGAGSAIPQAIIVSFAGYFFYLTRRVSGSNVLNSILHGLFDFALISGTGILDDQQLYVGTVVTVLAYPILAIVLIVERRHIEPVSSAPIADGDAAPSHA